MNELLLILGIGLALDFLFSRIVPKRLKPIVHVEDSPSGNTTSENVKQAQEAVRRLNESQWKQVVNAVRHYEKSKTDRSPIADTESRGLHQ